MGSKWTTLIIYNLSDQKMRFGELQKSLEGVSPRSLSMRLKQLEKMGVVHKKIYPEIPLHVEYSLTKKGASLEEIVIKMIEWGDLN